MTQYDGNSIEVLKGLEPAKKRPGMYTDTERPNHLAQEVIDNAVDEAVAGHADRIDVTVHEDGSLSVTDNGRGMPFDYNKKERKRAHDLILTELHSGGKFNKDSYTYSGGLHGVGVSVVNALSAELELSVRREGQRCDATFRGGKKKRENIEDDATPGTGTTIRFKPDVTYFNTTKFNRPALINALKSKAVLLSGLRVSYYDEESGREEVFYYDQGLSEYFSERCQGSADPIPESGWTMEPKWSGGEAQIILSFASDGQGVVMESFANMIPTIQGGTHVKALRDAVSGAVRNVGETLGLMPKNLTVTKEDATAALNALISIRVEEPSFAGQTKERLSNNEFVGELTTQVRDELERLMNQHPAEAQAIVELAIERAQARVKASKTVKRKKVTSGPALPGKLSDCIDSNFEQAELYLVEGDSAGGSAKQARDKKHQAIMPLRGKIQNTWEVETENLFSSKEVHDIAVAVGMDPGSEDLRGLRYNRVCILADADVDGYHIATLLCALFYRHFPALVEAGHLFIAVPPLYRIDQGKAVHYAATEQEKDDVVEKLESRKGNISVQRFKGLGEMNPEQLEQTVMSYNSRSLMQVRVEDSQQAQQHMTMLLGKKNRNSASRRREWLETHGDKADIE